MNEETLRKIENCLDRFDKWLDRAFEKFENVFVKTGYVVVGIPLLGFVLVTLSLPFALLIDIFRLIFN